MPVRVSDNLKRQKPNKRQSALTSKSQMNSLRVQKQKPLKRWQNKDNKKSLESQNRPQLNVKEKISQFSSENRKGK